MTKNWFETQEYKDFRKWFEKSQFIGFGLELILFRAWIESKEYYAKR